jgi:hypothetical protein
VSSQTASHAERQLGGTMMSPLVPYLLTLLLLLLR